jgi:hypothetical protein
MRRFLHFFQTQSQRQVDCQSLEASLSVVIAQGKWLGRLQQAGFTHGIHGIIWHQGENGQPGDMPSGDYGWKSSQCRFAEIAAGWRRDLPNARRYFMFQFWPNSCDIGGPDGASDRLREHALKFTFDRCISAPAKL